MDEKKKAAPPEATMVINYTARSTLLCCWLLPFSVNVGACSIPPNIVIVTATFSPYICDKIHTSGFSYISALKIEKKNMR